MHDIWLNFDEAMAIAIAMEDTGMSYTELCETPIEVFMAKKKLRKFLNENRNNE